VRSLFFVSGALFATWGVQVPAVKAFHGLSEQTLALAMLAAGAGALLALGRTGRWIARFGAARVVRVSGVLCALSLPGLLLWPGWAALLPLMALFGAAASVFDVAINAEAGELERLEARPLMSGFHGMFSLGGMVGAGAGSAVAWAGLAPPWHLALAAGVAVALLLAGAAWLLPMPVTAPGAPAASEAARADVDAPTRRALALLGALAGVGLIAEGAIYDWSVLFMRQELAAPATVAALAYAAFSGAMAAARFGGDAVRARVAPRPLLRGSCVLAAAGMGLALVGGSPAWGLVGFTLVGLGFANVVPVLFSAAARVPGVPPARAIARVSAVAYVAMMAGPPLIGLIAERSSLTVGLSVVVAGALLQAALAGRALPR
jgi:predicted MFS family arabinose efflux permease